MPARLRRCVIVTSLVVLVSPYVLAQRRDIRGRVTDATGAPAPGLTVQLIVGGETKRAAVTGADGTFRLDIVDLSEGQSQVRVVVEGLSIGSIDLDRAVPRKVFVVGAYTVEVRANSLATAAPHPPDIVPPPPPPPPPTATAPSRDNHAIIPVFFATDRNRVSFTPLMYGGDRERSRHLHLGRIDVSIPVDHHEVGNVERPDVWTLWREDPTKHFIIVKATEQPYADYYADVQRVVEHSRRREAFVFVHGFNVTFESAVYRTAQMAYDLRFDGAPVLYSWPSRGVATGYPVDANNSDWTIDRLHWFLEDLAARSGAQMIHVIAHSRGNWPLLNALRTIATEPRSTTERRPRFSQIVLTAPDVDADTFKVLARGLRMLADRTTLDASANDEALRLSKRYQGYQRAGDVEPEIVLCDGVDSIDVSAVDTTFVGHSYYGDNTSVISDIRRLLQTGFAPERRCGIEAVTQAALKYWTFLAHAVCPVGGTS
jgi:esterase/lipase superfamily enzyme